MEIADNLKSFLDNSLPAYCQGDDDGAVLAAIKNINMLPGERQVRVYTWLRVNYHVLMGFSTEAGMNIAVEVLKFADERKSSSLSGKGEISHAFNQLEERLKRVAPITGGGQSRNVISLTSKALWLSFPEDVPIYDSQAANALHVLSRLLGIERPADGTPYEQFVEVWLYAFEALMPAGYPSEYCLPKRAFDRWLWFLAQPNFAQ